MRALILGLCTASAFAMAAQAETITIATVNNGEHDPDAEADGRLHRQEPRHPAAVGDARGKRAARARHDRHRHKGRAVRRHDHRHLRGADLGEAAVAAAAGQAWARPTTPTTSSPRSAAACRSTGSSMPRPSTARARSSCTGRTVREIRPDHARRSDLGVHRRGSAQDQGG